MNTIFTRFLSALGVPHTSSYSDRAFRGMTFKSLYGLSHLLTEYGVENEAYRIDDKSELTAPATPYLARTKGGVFIIVEKVDTAAGRVMYDSLGEREEIGIDDFRRACDGVVLLAYPSDKSGEPDYRAHLTTEIISKSSGYLLLLAAVALFVYLFVTRGIYSSVWTVLMTVFDLGGLYLSYLLLLKSLHIRTAAQDRVCGILEQGGCDSIMELKVSKLFGVFSWSEVGFGYFGVSLAALLLFPHLLPQLALCNMCCLPYTFWSIWYQKFRAHHWCTMCVGVQTTLWLLFFCYLFSGAVSRAFALHVDLFALMAVYVAAVLSLNQLTRRVGEMGVES